MPQCALICLNNPEYAWIFLNALEQADSEYTGILNVSDASLHSIKSLYKLLSSY